MLLPPGLLSPGLAVHEHTEGSMNSAGRSLHSRLCSTLTFQAGHNSIWERSRLCRITKSITMIRRGHEHCKEATQE